MPLWSSCSSGRRIVVVVALLVGTAALGLTAAPAVPGCGTPGRDVCQDVDCSARGFCVESEGDPYCACIRGYHPVFLECVANDPVSPCLDVDCNGHGRCVELLDDPVCECDEGFGHASGSETLCLPVVEGDVRDVGECTPGSPEICDRLDNDCDGLTDELYDFDFDRLHCGWCGHRCPDAPHGVAACVLGACDVSCEAGWSDVNRDPSDGCEGPCRVRADGDERFCEGWDDDCDGRTDEEWSSSAACGLGACERPAICHHGEVHCVPRAPPAADDPTCDGLDDDCDGRVDEDGPGCAADADADADGDGGSCGNGVTDPGEECDGRSRSCGSGGCGTQPCLADCTWGVCDDPGRICDHCADGQCYNELIADPPGCGCLDGRDGVCLANCATATDPYSTPCGCEFDVLDPGQGFNCRCR